MGSDPAPFITNLFYINVKRIGFFKQKNWACKRLLFFQILLGLLMTYALSMIMNLKIIVMIFILMGCDSRKKMKILVKIHVWTFQ